MKPEIASRLTLIWIGGPEYTDLAPPPPAYTSLEYNLGIDIKAGQVIFNKSAIPIWQIPRNAYRQVLKIISRISFQSREFQMFAARHYLPGFSRYGDCNVIAGPKK